MVTQETGPGVPVGVPESPAEARVSGGLLQGWGLCVAVCPWDLWKEVAIIFIPSTRVWPHIKQQGRNTAPPFNRKVD